MRKLTELHPKPGDVAEYCYSRDPSAHRFLHVISQEHVDHDFEIFQAELPLWKVYHPWKAMSAAEKAALLLADHDGAILESSHDGLIWVVDNGDVWDEDLFYRVSERSEIKAEGLELRKEVSHG